MWRRRCRISARDALALNHGHHCRSVPSPKWSLETRCAGWFMAERVFRLLGMTETSFPYWPLSSIDSPLCSLLGSPDGAVDCPIRGSWLSIGRVSQPRRLNEGCRRACLRATAWLSPTASTGISAGKCCCGVAGEFRLSVTWRACGEPVETWQAELPGSRDVQEERAPHTVVIANADGSCEGVSAVPNNPRKAFA